MVTTLLRNELTGTQKEYISFDSSFTKSFLKALENAIINNDNGIGLPYWAAQDPSMVKALTFALVTLKYGKVTISRKYSRFEFDTKRLDSQKLHEFRTNEKLRKFLMRNDTKAYPSTMVRSNGKVTETGLNRPGFAKVAKNSFKYDVDALQRYYEPIRLTLVKSMRMAKEEGKLKDKYFVDEANFETVVKFCLDNYMLDDTYNLEYNVSDSRGRSIYNALKRVGNPISSKDFRSLIVQPAVRVHRENKEQMDDIYYFIAELLGSKAKSESTKIAQGKRWYAMRKVPQLDLTTEDGRDDLHELIWLERIYTKLDKLYAPGLPFISWDIPLEIDAGMSIAQVVGALTNETRLLERTNVIGSTLTDPWFIDGVRRKAAKSVGTPTFYGSSQSATSLIQKAGMNVDKDEVKAIRKEFATGGLAVMKLFKDAIIKNYNNHQPKIQVNIWKDSFTIEVNKMKQAGVKIIVTEAWDGKRYRKSFTHEPVLVPDYDRMKLFWATCLIHNLDSQLVDNIAYKMDAWMLTIHDAVLAAPGVAGAVRRAYAHELKQVNKERLRIIHDFRQSIGATDTKSDIAFMRLYEAVQQAEDIEFNASAMK